MVPGGLSRTQRRAMCLTSTRGLHYQRQAWADRRTTSRACRRSFYHPTVSALRIAPSVRDALEAGRPVVALESTIIAHGLPRPENLSAAREFEALLLAAGVSPATVAVIDGQVNVGLDDAQLVRVATDTEVAKLSVRNLPIAVAAGLTGATTVAATAHIASLAGIRVFATGGLGGVHRDAARTFDESADLTTLAATPITVVSAGVKSILDVPATLERLETLGVTVLGWRTHRFPGFWVTDSGARLDWSVPDGDAVAQVMAANDALGRCEAILVAAPIPSDRQLDPELHAAALEQALRAAEQAGLRGRAVTPFLLAHMVEATGGRSLEVNLALVRNNITVAAEIAAAWSSRARGASA